MMWGNIGEIEKVGKAIKKIDIHSEVWENILNSIGRTYSKNGKNNEFIKLLHDLDNKLTHPLSKTAIFYQLVVIEADTTKFISPAMKASFCGAEIERSDKQITISLGSKGKQ